MKLLTKQGDVLLDNLASRKIEENLRYKKFNNALFCDFEFEDISLIHSDFTGADFTTTQFNDCVSKHSNFSGSVFKQSENFRSLFNECYFRNVNFKYSQIQASKFIRSDFKNATFRGADINHTEFIDCDFSRVDFRGTILRDVTFVNCNMQDIRIEKSRTENLDLHNCYGLKYSNVNISKPGLYNIGVIAIEIGGIKKILHLCQFDSLEEFEETSKKWYDEHSASLLLKAAKSAFELLDAQD